MVTEAAVTALRDSLRGEVLEPNDEGYDAARKVHNGMIDRRPRLIAQCVDSSDVAAAVRFGREHDLPLAVRGGGHSPAGFGVCDDGLVIDLSRMRGVRVDPGSGTVRVAGGAVWGDVDHATHPFGLAVPAGVISTTGVGGLTLGGGHGNLTRKYGLTIDNLLEADVVLADGRQVTASAEEHPDLFWAIRGGGGNFGVVASFLFQGQPVETVFAGLTAWGLDHATEVLQWYREFQPNAPDDLYAWIGLVRVPPAPTIPTEFHGRPVCVARWCCLGPAAAAERALTPALGLGPPLLSEVGQVPFPKVQNEFDALAPAGIQGYWRAQFVSDLPDEAIATHLKFAGDVPTPLSAMRLFPVDGAAGRVAPEATAFSFREAKWSMIIDGLNPDPADAERLASWTKSYWEAVRPYSASAAYVNFLMDEGADRVKATYRDNYGRLQAIKGTYDPDNTFRLNQNIPPGSP
jgi:FAD/FMN-containing dehydrogenase